MKLTSHAVFPEVKIIENFYAYDIRGGFIKIFNETEFQDMQIDSVTRETYYSISKKDVIRGLHFQVPPFEHDKIVHVIRGSVMDVIIDLRTDSPHFKQYITIHLTGNKPRSIYIPKGFAHGFKCLENDTIMLYNVSSVYNKECDCGILWNSIGLDWDVEDPIITDRDASFPTLKEYVSPF